MDTTVRNFLGSHKVSDGFTSVEPSLTRQEFKDESDINYIVRMYDSTGVFPGVNQVDKSRQPMFGDFANLPEDAQSAYNMILDGVANFNALPIEIRKRFNYSPAAFFDFVQNPNNVDELVAMGLATKTVIDPPAEPPAEPPVEPPAK